MASRRAVFSLAPLVALGVLVTTSHASAQTTPILVPTAPAPASTSPASSPSPPSPASPAPSTEPAAIAANATTSAATTGEATNATELNERRHTTKAFTLGAYAEAFYQYNFNRPSNGITNYRGFDNRHNSFTLANVAVDARWDYANVVGRATLQIGHTPSTYYLAEPERAGTPGANATSAELWKYLQQAYVGYRFGVGNGLTLAAGLFLSPIGPEGLAIKDNWNWSRSNLFFGLPFYHTGARLTYPLTDRWTTTIGGYNGWNSVVDDNAAKSMALQLTYTKPDALDASFLYFGGVERTKGAAEGQYWRHLFDAHATVYVGRRLSLLGQVNGGFEPNRFGTSAWVAAAGYVRFQVLEPLFLVARADVFGEHTPQNDSGSARPIFWPVGWVASQTLTADVRPHEHVSLRVEYRHDQARGDLFFGGRITGDGTASPFLPNRRSQDTLTFGATTWF